MSRLTSRFVSCGVLAFLLAGTGSCADSGRPPTSPSAVTQFTPRALSWECAQQGPGTGGWSFDRPSVDCGPSAAPVADAGVGMVTAAPANLRSTITGTTVRLDWNPLTEPVTSFLIEA